MMTFLVSSVRSLNRLFPEVGGSLINFVGCFNSKFANYWPCNLFFFLR